MMIDLIIFALVFAVAYGLGWLAAKTRAKESSVSPDPENLGDLAEFVTLQKPLLAMADAMEWPKEWIVCPTCAAHSWRLPPHLFDGCPIVQEMSEAAGLKMDAERSQAVRSGISIERQMELLQAIVEKHFGSDDDD